MQFRFFWGDPRAVSTNVRFASSVVVLPKGSCKVFPILTLGASNGEIMAIPSIRGAFSLPLFLSLGRNAAATPNQVWGLLRTKMTKEVSRYPSACGLGTKAEWSDGDFVREMEISSGIVAEGMLHGSCDCGPYPQTRLIAATFLS